MIKQRHQDDLSLSPKKRTFVQLAQPYNPNKHRLAAGTASEKLDGQRALWDGGVTKGMDLCDVPWANRDKNARYKEEPKATGLWSRYGHPIQAPDFWTDDLPDYPLDGELWMGPGMFQKTMSITRALTGREEDWQEIQYKVFHSPSYEYLFCDGEVKETNYKKVFEGCADFINQEWGTDYVPRNHLCIWFDATLIFLERELRDCRYASVIETLKLPMNEEAAREAVDFFLGKVVARGGEGVIVRTEMGQWTPNRSHDLLKIKPSHDAEGTVVGYKAGKETELGSKLLGLIGALKVEFNGNTFWLSGLTNEMRRFRTFEATTWAEQFPGEEAPSWVEAKHFKRGDVITFQYRELSDDGIPKEARFLRHHVT